MKTILKLIFWILLSLVLLVAGSLICAVKILTPDKLTPIVQRIANNTLAADVTLGRVELKFDPAFPVLRVSVDSACVVSRAFDSLDPADKAMLPAYADTLLRFDHFSGAIGLDKMLSRGEIALRDVVLRGPEVNIVVASDSVCNYNLLAAAPEDTTETAAVVPPFSINRFSLEDARAIRYYNAVDSTDATVILLSNAGLDGTQAPSYRIKIDGNLQSPVARGFIDLERVSFGADGHLRWDPRTPEMLAFEKFSISGAFFHAKVDAEIALGDDLVIRSASFGLSPVAVDSLLLMVPADMRSRWRLSRPYFSTPAEISLKGALTRPFNLTVDTIPHAVLDLSIPETPLAYGKMKFVKLALDLGLELKGNDPDSAKVDIRRLTAAGPATQVDLRATLMKLMSDPRFDACLKLRSDISRLPSVVAQMAQGYLSGVLDADIDIRGRQSMFDLTRLHLLDVEGEVNARDFYYLSNDTNLMAQVGHARLAFGTGKRYRDADGKYGERTLAAGIRVDTANVLSGGIGMGMSGIVLGLGVENKTSGMPKDTTMVVPMGGILKIGRFNLTSVSDSAGMRLRQLEGSVGITRYKDRKRTPQFNFDLHAKRISAGAPAARVMLRDPHIVLEAHRIYSRRMVRKIRHLADSLSKVHPELSPDSVYRLAIEKRRHRPGEKVHHRVHTELTGEEQQTLEWGTSKALRKLLLTWEINGSVKTRRARLFTPMFPLKNRISNVDIRFNNDSIILTDIRYKGGRSNITVNGIISNMKRGFTSKGYRSPLRANLMLTSSSIDVNELAAATFAGAAYADRLRKGEARRLGIDDLDGSEDDFEARMKAQTDSTATGPLLIPTNVDAQVHVRADSIFYSDLLMRNLEGDMLVYNGALNLNNLRCSSDIGSLTLDALYSAPGPDNMQFGFGLDARRFDIRRFLKLVPAVDSIMPLMRDFGGTISADLAATCRVDSSMNLLLPTLDAAIRLQGDSLQFIDSKTYRTIGKWLGFKDKESNIVKHLDVELTVRDDILQIYPFMLDIDRYRLGVQGYNDLALNFNYHIAVLKSPIPFKFGITVKGTPDDYKVRFGGAKFKADAPAASVAIVDTARVNLLSQIRNIFRRGVAGSRFARIDMQAANDPGLRRRMLQADAADTLSRADSLILVQQGVFQAGPAKKAATPDARTDRKSGKSDGPLFLRKETSEEIVEPKKKK